MSDESVLHDKYTHEHGVALMSGTQALVVLMLAQQRADQRAGLKTLGYVTGYRGSPLGGVDQEFLAARSFTAGKIRFEPATNEELAATAVLGTQQLASFGAPTVDGVFSLWYGKGPGVDRAGDAMKHGNMAGTSQHGGVLIVFGDDHPGKSSTVAHQSEQALVAHFIPILYPASVSEIVAFGLYGLALSRYTGLWVGLKLVNETAEQTATVDLDEALVTPTIPPEVADESVHFTGSFNPQGDEERVIRRRLPLVSHFSRSNPIDRIVFRSPDPVICLVATGKAFGDVMQALELLKIDRERAERLGITVYKPGMIWPLSPCALDDAVGTSQEIFVVEEKRAFVEMQIASLLFNRAPRVRLIGKSDLNGRALLPSDVQLNAADIAAALAQEVHRLGRADSAISDFIDHSSNSRRSRTADPAILTRVPYFCSGCPHNTSTKLPAGSLGFSGIGCHGMVMSMGRNTRPPVQMGGEGANWIGAAAFVDTPHVFQNLGDGTYFHSGLLAVRASVAAKMNVTYKILYNDAVAMTGGQKVEGGLTVADIARQLLAERVTRCVIVSEEPRAHSAADLPAGVLVYGRDALAQVQNELRRVPGVTAVIFEQVCAAEKRRRRKRGLLAEPTRRLFINPDVCEGCGDCSATSNCVSLVPTETEFGRKRQIDQSTCNKDYSCADGFCPSFVSISGVPATRRDAHLAVDDPLLSNLDEPVAQTRSAQAVLLTGIGGTGVTTMGAVLAMAAHLDGKSAANYNMTGMAQKGGAVLSHLRFGSGSEIHAAKLGKSEADLIIGCDILVTAGDEALSTLSARSRVMVNRHAVPTGHFQLNPEQVIDVVVLSSKIASVVEEPSSLDVFDSTDCARRYFGDELGANFLLVGRAYQRGWLNLSAKSIEGALRINGAAVDLNIASFRLGRATIVRPGTLLKLAEIDQPVAPMNRDLDSLISHQTAWLTRYHDSRYAERYRDFVERTRRRLEARLPGDEQLLRIVCINLAKLMAYKDEYEVARLFTGTDFLAKVRQQYSGRVSLQFHMAPPLIGTWLGGSNGVSKMSFGGWLIPVMQLLAKGKVLRDTPFDPFGWLPDRRTERRLIIDYMKCVEEALEKISVENREAAARLFSYPDIIKGYGHVKAKSIEKAVMERSAAWSALE